MDSMFTDVTLKRENRAKGARHNRTVWDGKNILILICYYYYFCRIPSAPNGLGVIGDFRFALYYICTYAFSVIW